MIRMKGITNGAKGGMTIQKITNLTFQYLASIPNDTVWDLVSDKFMVHGIGPITEDEKPVTGGRCVYSSSASRFYYGPVVACKKYNDTIQFLYYTNTASSGTIQSSSTTEPLTSFVLYLYDGGGSLN